MARSSRGTAGGGSDQVSQRPDQAGRRGPEPRPACTRLMVMMPSRQLATTLAALAVPIALATGCASATSARPAVTISERPPPTTGFSAMGLAFRYPASWQRSRTWASDQPGLSGLMVYLSSTSRLKAPCITSITPGRIAQTCEYPIRALPQAEVLVRWTANSFPNWHMPKPNTAIADRRAVETRTTRGWCAPLHATETITVIIPRAAPGHWYQMDACLRSPGLPQQEAQISSMLKSIRIAKDD